MDTESICSAWKTAFPGAEPAGFRCRAVATERWVRTHSLPGSKQYPATTTEYAEVLHRYNQTASEVLTEESKCVLFVTRFGTAQRWDAPTDGPLRGRRFAHVMSAGDGDDQLQFFTTETTWRAGAFDAMLTAVANDHGRHILFFNPRRRSAFAPYDGGADFFLATKAQASEMQIRFATWLSVRSDGL
jgi:hypothetical protein